MSSLTASPAWQALIRHRRAMDGVSTRSLFAADPDRFARFSAEACGVLLDYSKNRITAETLELLTDLARSRDLEGWRARLFAGDAINSTEGRAVLHTALRQRHDAPVTPGGGANVIPEVRSVMRRLSAFVDGVRFGRLTGLSGRPFKDVVNIGIGGSDLGPLMVSEALRPYHHPELRIRYVSNVDGTHLYDTLDWLDPETTLFIITSKTFTTEETMANARSARDWFLGEGGSEADIGRHFVAVSANAAAVRAFGIGPESTFTFWDWVGGRFSLWSAVGLPVALAVGMERFDQLLAGAHAMDEHFRTAPLTANLPALLGLLGVWTINFWDAPAQAVVPYDQYLHRLPAYLQQLDMESNGKSVDRDGRAIDYATAPVIFGEPGTNAQHSFFQLLHQGPRPIPVDFLAAAESHNPFGEHHQMLLANMLAQSEALMRGRSADEARAELEAAGTPAERLAMLLPHKVFEGSRPSNTLLYQKLDPFTLGALIALYEHKIFVQGVIWGVNSFDQWGVELGKALARTTRSELATGPQADHDSSTTGLLHWLHQRLTAEVDLHQPL
ncbi:MAG: glucose-6-phosphate isomerase [Rhodospirillaceae bacterium]